MIPDRLPRYVPMLPAAEALEADLPPPLTSDEKLSDSDHNSQQPWLFRTDSASHYVNYDFPESKATPSEADTADTIERTKSTVRFIFVPSPDAASPQGRDLWNPDNIEIPSRLKGARFIATYPVSPFPVTNLLPRFMDDAAVQNGDNPAPSNRPLSKLALAGEIDDFSADFCAERGNHTQRVGDERGQKSAKKRDLNSRMEFRKRSNDDEPIDAYTPQADLNDYLANGADPLSSEDEL